MMNHLSLEPRRARRRWTSALAVLVAGPIALVATAGAATATDSHRAPDRGAGFRQTNLVSDLPGLAALTDPDLINPWGVAYGPTTPLWTANQGSGTSTLYTGTRASNAQQVPLVVAAASPTGTVYNPTKRFVVTQNGVTAPSRFLFAENAFSADPDAPPTASITGWHDGTSTVQASAGKVGAFYAGLALVPRRHEGRGPMLLAADNAPGGTIDVYNGAFHRVVRPARRSFVDPRVDTTKTPPYNVAYLRGRVYVAYAPNFGEPGASAVSVFTPGGQFLRRLVTGHRLNGPWGMTIAPRHWGRFGGDLLVGNVYDGTINAYDLGDGEREGTLKGRNGKPLVNLGLWGIGFGNGVIGTPRTLVFAAGIGTTPSGFDEVYEHGLVGLISPARHAHHD